MLRPARYRSASWMTASSSARSVRSGSWPGLSEMMAPCPALQSHLAAQAFPSARPSSGRGSSCWRRAPSGIGSAERRGADMAELLEYLVRGVLIGVTYGLLAYPISLLFVATATIDLAVGSYAVLAAAVATTLPAPYGF